MKAILAILICAGTLALSANAASAATFTECDAYARQVANDNVAKRTAGTAVVGALLGLGIGAAQGNNLGSSAAIGAGAGGVTGLAVGSVEWQKIYDAELDDCMGSSGHTNVGSQTGLYEPWSPEWFEYCDERYQSFDETDGTFQPFEGPRRLCR
jgi:ribonucleotide reductase alpha subunit